ncbi:glycosyltransferase family 2 protein [Rufibacter tibetensis]|uniref:glycosyltransferase family 2 protein n=1 Tax=Rufibacter tibetensis TaxID=512763 RepID=UPI0007867DCC|nr:glycosyltransferase [Rufibacter tibetensis]
MFVSVIIPNFNHARFLEQRIESVLNQTYNNFEVIILDDCSLDNSIEVIERYRGHPKVSHIVYNKNNSGSTFKQWNKGVSLAIGEWIWFAESDDFCELNFLEIVINNIKNNCVISFSQSNQVDESGTVLRDMLWHTDSVSTTHWLADYYNSGKDETLRYLLHKNTIPNASGVIFKKDAYLQVDRDFEKMKQCGDWLLWVKLLNLGDISFTTNKLNYFRSHSATTRTWDNYSKRKRRFEEELDVIVTIGRFYPDEYLKIDERKKSHFMTYAAAFTKKELIEAVFNYESYIGKTSFFEVLYYYFYFYFTSKKKHI